MPDDTDIAEWLKVVRCTPSRRSTTGQEERVTPLDATLPSRSMRHATT
jgi:hypothetical protein